MRNDVRCQKSRIKSVCYSLLTPKDYTDRVERIYFAPILMPEGTNGIEEEKWFDEGKRAIMLKVKIDQVALNQIQLGQSISTILKKHLTKFLPNRLFAGIDYALRMPE